MVLSPKEQAQLEALSKKAEEPDPDENTLIEIEIEGRVVRIPYRKAKPWLKKQGIDLDDILEEAAQEGDSEEEEEEVDEGEELPEELEDSPRPKARKRVAKVEKEEAEVPRGKSYWRKQA